MWCISMKTLSFLLLALLSSVAVADMAGQVMVENPFARAAIQQQRNSAAFMEFNNRGDAAGVVFAKSPVARVVELHTHINDQGVMRMRKINQIDLPAQHSVSLQPGGMHIMLLGLNRDLNPGDEIELTLGFIDGSEKKIQVPVHKVMMQKMKQMQGHKLNGSLPAMMHH